MDDEKEILKLLWKFEEKFGSGKFTVDVDGDFCIKQDDPKAELSKICNFVLFPVEAISNEKNGKEEVVKYIFDVVMRKKEIIKNREVNFKDLTNIRWINKLNPFCKIYKPIEDNHGLIKDFIYDYFHSNNVKVLEYNSIGWNFYDSKWFYLYSDGVFINSEETREIKTTVDDFVFKENSNILPKDAFEKSLEMLEYFDKKLTYSLLCHLLTSLLLTPLNEVKDLSPNFSLWIYGKTGLGKTSLANLFTKIFKIDNAIHINSYRNDLKKAGIDLKDCILIIDDYGAFKDRKAEREALDKLEKMTRSTSDKANNINSKRLPKCMLLFTGESFLEMNDTNDSTISRMIRVKMENIFNTAEKGYAKEKEEYFSELAEGNYIPTTIKYYIKWLSGQINDNLLSDYRKDLKKLRNEFKVTYKIHPRFIDSAAHLTIAFNFYMTYGKEMGFITPEQYADHCNRAKLVLVEVMKEQDPSIPVPDINIEVFLDALMELIVDKRIKINIITSTKESRLNPSKGYLGILDLETNKLRFIWNLVYPMVTDLLRLKNNNFIKKIGLKRLGKMLVDADFIDYTNSEKGNNVTRQLIVFDNYKNVNYRVIDFYTKAIPEITEIVIGIYGRNETDELPIEEDDEPFMTKKERKKNEKRLKEISGELIPFDRNDF